MGTQTRLGVSNGCAEAKHISVGEVKEDKLHCLARCAVGEAKTTEILDDLPFL